MISNNILHFFFLHYTYIYVFYQSFHCNSFFFSFFLINFFVVLKTVLWYVSPEMGSFPCQIHFSIQPVLLFSELTWITEPFSSLYNQIFFSSIFFFQFIWFCVFYEDFYVVQLWIIMIIWKEALYIFHFCIRVYFLFFVEGGDRNLTMLNSKY